MIIELGVDSLEGPAWTISIGITIGCEKTDSIVERVRVPDR